MTPPAFQPSGTTSPLLPEKWARAAPPPRVHVAFPWNPAPLVPTPWPAVTQIQSVIQQRLRAVGTVLPSQCVCSAAGPQLDA